MDVSDDPSLAVQKAMRARLISYPSLTALVPADHIIDKSKRPDVFPCIIIGESQTTDEGYDFDRSFVRVYHTLHIWQREEGLSGVKTIAQSVRRALRTRFWLSDPDYHLVDAFVSDARFLRDPSGEHGHGILTYESLLQENWVYEV